MKYKKAGFFIICFCILIALGFWQVYRLEYKKNLIELYKANPTKQLHLSEMRNFSDQDIFKQVDIKGSFIKHPIYYYFPIKSQVFYIVYQPFETRDSMVVLVNRGLVKDKNIKLNEAKELKGTAMSLSNKTNITIKNDYKKNSWFYLNYKELSNYYKIDNLLPVIIFSNQANVLVGKPISVENKVFVRNDHFQYAVTWFSLAVVALIFAIFSFKKEKVN